MKNFLLLAFIFSLSSALIANTDIELALDLAHDSSTAKAQNKPIVFFVTADHCPYCMQLRDEYFKFSPDDDRFILREIELDKHHTNKGFDGKPSNHKALARRYNISLTPTVLFVGPNGEMLSDPIVGVLTMDFYHYYFEKALAESITNLRAPLLILGEVD